MITTWRKYDSQFLMYLLRRLCQTDERLIRSLLRSPDEEIVQGSLNRPIVAKAVDIKAVMDGMTHTAARTWNKVVQMFQYRDDVIVEAFHKCVPPKRWQSSKYLYIEGNVFDRLIDAIQQELEVN